MNKKLYELMDWAEMEAITYAEADKPKNLLGARSIKKNQSLVQGYYPGCEKMSISIEDGKYVEMDMADEEGFFAILCKADYPFMYKLKAELTDGSILEYTDPYSFGQIMPKKALDAYLEGTLNNAYEYFGANVTEIGGIKGTVFAVYAPNAMRVSVVGSFNNWDGRIHQMQKIDDSGVYELFIPNVDEGDLYKFEIKLRDGNSFLKPDPYAKASQMMPDNASIVTDISKYAFADKKYIAAREKKDFEKNPMLIYEVDLCELMSKTKGAKNCLDIADKLIAHMKKFSYTHVEFLPIMNCVDEKSRGYDTVGYFALNARFGSLDDFRNLVDKLHANGYGVILEWSIDHFPNDENFMKNFDGSCVFEHQDPKRGFNPKYGTLLYNYGRPQISSFLLSAAKYYIKELHVDGLKSTISSMLYLDYDKQDGEWLPNVFGGKENLDAIEFIKKLNNMLTVEHKGILSIAMDDTAWFDVTRPVADGGLGFSLKWNNGMIEDVLGYVKNEPYMRTSHYGELCFPLVYAFNEKFVLNLSHEQFDDNASLLYGLPGSDDEKEATLRTLLGFYMMHPGKKLMYMGLDEVTPGIAKYVAELNKLYINSACMYDSDFTEDGFEWINCISANENIVVFMRKSISNDKIYIILCNFLSAPRNNYKIGVPGPCEVKEIFTSDAEKFGGFGFVNSKAKLSRGDECDGYDDSVRIKVPPLGMIVFEYMPLED